jgi:oligosaccharide repeat unit polymerase
MQALLSNAQPQRRQARPIVVILAHGLLMAILMIAYFYCWGLELRPEGLIYPSSVVLVALFIWELWSWKKLTGRLFDPYSVFLIAATVFNGGQAVLEALCLNEQGILADKFSPQTIFNALALVIFGLASLHLGALISATKRTARMPQTDEPPKTTWPLENIRLVGWVLLVISLPAAVFLFRDAIGVVLAGGYSALYETDAATGLDAGPRVLASLLVPAALFLLVGGKGTRTSIIVSAIVLLGYAVIQLFLGYRYHAMMPIVAYVWLWHRCIRRIPFPALLTAGAIVLFVIFPVVGLIRNTSGAERMSMRYLQQAFTSVDNPGIAAVSEMGGSMATVAYTLDLVPDDRDYDMGASYFYAALTLFPNLFWDIHPSIAHGTASNWLIWEVNPYNARRGGGLGYSIIAEAFLNFGWWGTPLVLGLIGFFYGKFVLWGERSFDPAKLATVACFFAFFTLIARGESALVTRPLVWYVLGPYALIQILAAWRKSRTAKSLRPASAS